MNAVRRSAAQIRDELTEKVLDAIRDADEHDDSRCDDAVYYHDMAEAAVEVFAAALDEIHENHGEVPDIKRSTIDL